MIYVLYAILVFFALLFVLISFPVKLWVDSSYILKVKWFILGATMDIENEGAKPRFILLGRKLKPRVKKEKKTRPAKAKKKKKKEKKKRPQSKVTGSIVLELLRDKAISKALRRLRRFSWRLIGAIKITMCKVEFGLSDFYRQGIIIGALQSVPIPREFQISGNFEERTNFDISIRVSILRIVMAVMLFIFTLPYISAIRLYFRYRRLTGLPKKKQSDEKSLAI